MRKRLGILLLALAVPAAAQRLSDDAVQRLAALGRVWGAVKFAHPSLGYRDIDWDGAAIRAIPAARDAQSPEQFAAAVDAMLSALGDPDTRVTSTACGGQAGAVRAPRDAAAGALTITHEMLTAPALDPALPQAIKAAKVVVVDLRTPPGTCGGALPQAGAVVSLLFNGTVAGLQQRSPYHDGYRGQVSSVGAIYTSFWSVTGPALFTGTNDAAARVTFVVDEHSPIPPGALALVRLRRAAIVSVGPFHDDALLPPLTFDLGGGFQAVVKRAELVDGSGNPAAAAPLLTLPAGSDDDAVMAAAVSAAPSRHRASGFRGDAKAYVWRADDPYPSMHYPDFAYRILAAYRLWNVIETFYAYKELMPDWQPRLAEIVAMFAATSSAAEYELAIAKAMTYVPDGHSFAGTSAYLDLRGRAGAPFLIMPVEGKPVVVSIFDNSATAAGVEPGDELTAIDGRAASERIDELRTYVSASTDAALTYYAMTLLPRGPENSTAKFTFRKSDGTMHEATLARSSSFGPHQNGQPWKTLPGNIGYVDLDWLQSADINRMIDAMDGTRGLILDMRGYPNGDLFQLGRRLDAAGKGEVAQLFHVAVEGGIVRKNVEVQSIGRSTLPVYRGKTVMLVDERSQSASEHMALICEALAGTTFAGSPTAGANGNITVMVLPGANYVDFGGLDVRHLDGRQLQRVGVIPHVLVPRTVGGLAHGRDEVLEKAVEILSNAKP